MKNGIKFSNNDKKKREGDYRKRKSCDLVIGVSKICKVS